MAAEIEVLPPATDIIDLDAMLTAQDIAHIEMLIKRHGIDGEQADKSIEEQVAEIITPTYLQGNFTEEEVAEAQRLAEQYKQL